MAPRYIKEQRICMGELKKGLSGAEIDQEFEYQLQQLEFGTVEITPLDEFKKMLKHSISEAKPLNIKLGIDPTNPDIHIGHLVPVRRMRLFQDLGHKGTIIIGDYTAQIGDPTGKQESRPPLTLEQTRENAKAYMDQLYTVLDKKKTTIRYQSEWFKERNLMDLMSWAGQTTVAKLLSHETFGNRVKENQSLGLHELFYPVLQGIDSVYIKADVELGGTDQKFNVLMGRDYQKNQNMRPQCALLTPILIGTDGTQKMSKSLGNYIGVFDEPFDKFGKVMSIPDEQMENYAKYAAHMNHDEFEKFASDLKSGSLHPNEAKKQLASRVVAFFHGDKVGEEMRMQFERVFAKKKVPDDIPEHKFERGATVLQVMVGAKLCTSNGEARRLLKQNAVGIVDGDKIADEKFAFDESFHGRVLKVGKRKFLKLL
jgi:tyrosyl-tRNA synthetase